MQWGNVSEVLIAGPDTVTVLQIPESLFLKGMEDVSLNSLELATISLPQEY
jgi:hypothetical protein